MANARVHVTPAEALRLCAARSAPASRSDDDIPVAELACGQSYVRRALAMLDAPAAVLLTGPTGSGKSALARSVLSQLCETVVCHDAATASPSVVSDVIRNAGSGSLGGKTGYILEGVDAPRVAARVGSALRGAKLMRSRIIMIAIDPESVRPVASAVGRRNVLTLAPVPLPNMTWALARVALREGHPVDDAVVRKIAQGARGDLRAALRALEWSVTGQRVPDDITLTLPDFFARSNQETIKQIMGETTVGRAVDIALSDRGQVGALLACASMRARPARRHAWRMSQALSDEDVSGYTEASFASVVMAARACGARRTVPPVRFPGREAFGTAPVHRRQDIDMAFATHLHVTGKAKKIKKSAQM